jgi:hypothetical protein
MTIVQNLGVIEMTTQMKRAAAACMLLASVFSPVVLAQDVSTAVVHIGVDDAGAFGIDNAVNFLLADGRFSTVDNIDVDASGVPTAQELSAYDSVLVATDNRAGALTGGGLGTQLGDVLDDYVMGGGRVVMSTFSGDTGIGIDGDILSLAPHIPQSGNGSAGSLNMATIVPHPVFDGITSFQSQFASTLMLSPNGIEIGTYEGGNFCVLTVADDSVMFVNGFPASQNDYSNGSDFGLLFANALAMEGGRVRGPSIPIPTMNVIGGGILVLVLMFAGIAAGRRFV